MSKKTVANLLVDTLVAAGVKRVYGLAGDSLNGITDSIRTRDDIHWIPVRHEETAAFAAGAEAHLTGHLAVCAGSCGPGNLHLINGLYDCHRSRVPVLAIAAQIPATKSAADIFRKPTRNISSPSAVITANWSRKPEQMPRVLEIAMQTAISRRGVAVIALPGDVALHDAVNDSRACISRSRNRPCVLPMTKSAELATILNASKKDNHPWRRGLRRGSRRS